MPLLNVSSLSCILTLFPRRKKVLFKYLPLLLILTVGTILRFYNLGKQPLWVDEINTWMFAKMSWGYLWGETAARETNPPLFYSIEKLVLFFGQSEFVLRFPAAIFGVVNLIAAYLLGKTLVNSQVGIVTAALIATSRIQVQYSQEARTYSMLVLVSTLVLWSFVRILLIWEKKISLFKKQRSIEFKNSLHNDKSHLEKQSKDTKITRITWITYVVGALIAIYSHNTAFLLILSTNLIFICWLIANKFYRYRVLYHWIFANIIILVGSLWWLSIMATQNVPTWIPYPTISSLIKSISTLYFQAGLEGITAKLIRLLILGIALFGILIWLRKKQLNLAILPIFFSIGIVIFGYIISFWKPILIPRVFLWTTIPFSIIVAFGIVSLKPKFIKNFILAIILIFQLANLNHYYQTYQKEPWDKVVTHISDRIEKEDIILIYKANIEAFLYYVDPSITDGATDPNIKKYTEDKVTVPIYRIYGEDYQIYPQIVRNLSQKNRRIWLILRARTATERNLEKPPGEILLQEAKHYFSVVESKNIESKNNQLLEIFLLEKV